jgi:hypothetical protein
MDRAAATDGQLDLRFQPAESKSTSHELVKIVKADTCMQRPN